MIRGLCRTRIIGRRSSAGGDGGGGGVASREGQQFGGSLCSGCIGLSMLELPSSSVESELIAFMLMRRLPAKSIDMIAFKSGIVMLSSLHIPFI